MAEKDLFIRFARSMRDGVCRCALDDGSILFANRGFVNILRLQCRPEALTGKLLSEVCVGLGTTELLVGGRGVHGRVCRFSTLMGEGRRVILDSFITGDQAARARVATLIIRDVTARARRDEEDRVRETSSRRRLEELVKTTAVALHESEARYRALIEQIPAITYIAALDEASTTLFVSPQIEMIGYTPDDYRADPDIWRKRLHPDDRERVLAEVARRRDLKWSFSSEYRLIARDGRVIWFRDDARVVRGASGEPLCIQGVMSDITERKRIEGELARYREHLEEMVRARTLGLMDANERLRANEDKYRSLVEHARSIIMEMDRDGRVTFFNEYAERFFGFSKDEILGKSVIGTIVPEAEFSGRNLGRLLARRVRTPDAIVMRENITRDGRRVWVAWTNSAIRNARGALVGVLSIGNDVTDRKRMEIRTAQLNRMKERLIGTMSLRKKLGLIADAVVEVFGADFARIWMTAPGDLCGKGCIHAGVTRGPHVCRDRSLCLHLMTSSGRYTRIDGGHRRVPMGCDKIGRVASGADPGFITNDVVHDPCVHDHEWARSLGLVSFAGYRLLSDADKPIGVFSLFSARTIAPEEEALLQDVANTISQVIAMGKAEEALRASESQYRTTIDSLTEAIHVVDAGLRILLVNRVFARLARKLVIRGGLIGKTVCEAFPFLPDTVRDEYARVFRTGRMCITEERIVLRGREAITETRKIPVLAGGKTVRVITAITDITARRRAEEAIRESERKYRAIMEGAGDAIFLVDTEGRLLEINRRGQELLGYSKRALAGAHFTRLHPPGSRARIAAAFREIRENTTREVPDVPLLARDGKIIPVDISGSVIRYGDTTLLQAIMRDISERKRVEAMKDNLIRDISHELKAPIAMMEMAHGMADEALAARDIEGIRKAKEILARNLAVLARDVGTIVGMFALSGRTMAPRPERVSLAEIAGEIADEMRDRIGGRKLALTVRIGRGADRITADRRMVRTLLYNLMDNAFKFTQRGRIALVAAREGGGMTIRVRDTGQGLAPRDAEQAFTRFYKKNPAAQGTGLGLPICREIAALHGGTIRLESGGRGKGTTVVVRLPLRRVAPRRAGRGGAG